jgi:hypothetical protein
MRKRIFKGTRNNLYRKIGTHQMWVTNGQIKSKGSSFAVLNNCYAKQLQQRDSNA